MKHYRINTNRTILNIYGPPYKEMAYIIEEDDDKYLWAKWEMLGDKIKSLVGNVIIKENIIILLVQHYVTNENILSIKQIYDYLDSLPLWEKTKYYVSNPYYGRVINIETGKTYSRVISDRILTRLNINRYLIDGKSVMQSGG
jgi:hypothetical protein